MDFTFNELTNVTITFEDGSTQEIPCNQILEGETMLYFITIDPESMKTTVTALAFGTILGWTVTADLILQDAEESTERTIGFN